MGEGGVERWAGLLGSRVGGGLGPGTVSSCSQGGSRTKGREKPQGVPTPLPGFHGLKYFDSVLITHTHTYTKSQSRICFHHTHTHTHTRTHAQSQSRISFHHTHTVLKQNLFSSHKHTHNPKAECFHHTHTHTHILIQWSITQP